MFPDKALYPRYEARAQRKLPQVGDISARSALTIHRGTANRSQLSRPVFVLGVDAPDARNAEKHDLQVTQATGTGAAGSGARPPDLPGGGLAGDIYQAHTIEGLRMGLTGRPSPCLANGRWALAHFLFPVLSDRRPGHRRRCPWRLADPAGGIGLLVHVDFLGHLEAAVGRVVGRARRQQVFRAADAVPGPAAGSAGPCCSAAGLAIVSSFARIVADYGAGGGRGRTLPVPLAALLSRRQVLFEDRPEDQAIGQQADQVVQGESSCPGKSGPSTRGARPRCRRTGRNT
jgi:hypothetical protein